MPAPVVAIIGAGQAGFQAAASLRETGFAGRVLLIGDEPVLPYQRPPLSKSYLAGQSGVDDLWLRPAEFYAKQQIDLAYGDAVTAIDREQRRLHLASGNHISWDHLVVATGAGCRPLAVPGAELDGVLTLRTLADADALRQRLDEAREVVVVGAGFIGLEFAAVALARGTMIHIIEVTRQPMGRVVSEPVSRFFAEAHIGWGAEVALGIGIARILGAGGRVAGVETTDGRRIPADLVLICIGVIPNAQLAGDAGLAGRPVPYHKVPWFWSDQGDLKLQIAGITIGHDTSVLRGDPTARNFSVFCFRGRRLIGVESVNRTADHVVARRLLAGDPTLSPEQAADEGFDLRAHARRLPGR